MICPICFADSKVKDSRRHNDGMNIWRRRRCVECRYEWSTVEVDLVAYHRLDEMKEMADKFQTLVQQYEAMLNRIDLTKAGRASEIMTPEQATANARAHKGRKTNETAR